MSTLAGAPKVKSFMFTVIADAGAASNNAPINGRNFWNMGRTFSCGDRRCGCLRPVNVESVHYGVAVISATALATPLFAGVPCGGETPDRTLALHERIDGKHGRVHGADRVGHRRVAGPARSPCLLYTSDAADERSS